MNNPDPLLAQLRDIHTPEPISWWPLAPGWWILLALIIAAIVILTIWLRSRKTRSTAISESLRQLRQLPDQASKEDLVQLLHLFRRAALVYLPREQVASITLDALAQKIAVSHGLTLSPTSLELMRDAHYRPDTLLKPEEWQRLKQDIEQLLPLLTQTTLNPKLTEFTSSSQAARAEEAQDV
jgi:hypothetical protein